MQQTDTAESPEIEVGLYLIGDFAPDKIGLAFDVVPIFSAAKGSERRHKKTGRLLGIYEEATWGFTSGQAVMSNEISDHVAWLIEKSSAARGLVNDHVHAFIEITMRTTLYSTSCMLPKDLLFFARELSAEIGIGAKFVSSA
ncbi:MAG: hypothetical protein IPH35_04685 [Rhodoferax sp.]|nr:hypothetical protein [Rhodoferax sp.]